MESMAANAQETVGTSAMDLLKELESYRAEREVKSTVEQQKTTRPNEQCNDGPNRN